VALPAPGGGQGVPRATLQADLEEEALLLRDLLLGNVSYGQLLNPSFSFLPRLGLLKDFSSEYRQERDE
jgi:hypothetical protein